MMRRRRAAGGPAEDVFSNLLGLDLRPRRLRDASAMWAALTRTVGATERDALWAHPDILPSPQQLPEWEEWLAARAVGDDVDRELAKLLADEPQEGPDDALSAPPEPS